MRTLHIGLRVADLERSLAFYTGLGYQKLGEVPETAFGSLTMLKLPGDEFVSLELVHDPTGGRIEPDGLNHFVIQERSDGTENLTYNNPYGSEVERVRFDGRMVYALDCGEIELDFDENRAARQKVAQEYQNQKVPKRSYLTKREADLLLSAIVSQATIATNIADEDLSVREDERRALASALAARDHAAFSAMIYAGLRIEETTALTDEDLDFSRGEEQIRVAKGKGNKERLVPMGPKLKKSLKRCQRFRNELAPVGQTTPPYLFLNEKGQRVTENTLRRRLYKWVRQSAIKKQDIKPHDLRRTFGTWYLQDNPGQFVEVAELMGHSDLSQVMKYALSDEQRARAGVARL